MSTPLPATLRPLSEKIQRRLELEGDLPARLQRPNLPAARELAAVFWECLHTLSTGAELEAALARAIDFEALYGSFDAFLAFRAKNTAVTASALVEVWTSTSLTELRAMGEAQAAMLESLRRYDFEAVQADLAESVSSLGKGVEDIFERQEWLVVFHQAVEQIVTSELGGDQARTALRGVMGRLELSQDDVGRIFGVSGETIRRWERGVTSIPAQRRGEILDVESALRRLQDLFRPDRLPTVIRRPARLFDDETALEWILRGRIAEVADRYEDALLYQA